MEENNEFLKFIYHEDLYIIDEPKAQNIKVEQPEEPERTSDEEPEKIKIEEVATPVVEELKPVICFGNNEKRILILTHDPTNDFLNQNDLDFLMKIIESGLRYSKNDFALVNTAKFAIDQILDEIEFTFLISFGIDELSIANNKPTYEVLDLDGKKNLFAENLGVISCDQNKKMQLWKALKAMFNI